MCVFSATAAAFHGRISALSNGLLASGIWVIQIKGWLADRSSELPACNKHDRNSCDAGDAA